MSKMGTQITNYDQAMAEAAARYANQRRAVSESTFLSTKAGVLSFNDQPLPGNQLACVILDSFLENTYYEGEYDATRTVPPTCYAFSRESPDDMFPHETMQAAPEFFMPQHIVNGQVHGCKGCPQNEWGSARVGKGKACRNLYRLAIIPAGIYQQPPGRRDYQLQVFEDVAHYAEADVLYLKVAPTQGKAWEDYRDRLMAEHGRPPFGVITRIYLMPDARTQFSINYETVELLPNELIGTVIDRNNQLVSQPFKGYDAPDKDQKPRGGYGAPSFNRR